MAVANFQYITRMSSGFKVYILEGQPNLRSEDRYRHMANDRVRAPQVYPAKRKRSHERGLTLEERRERALLRSSARAGQRPVPAAPLSAPQSPTFSWSSTPSPTSPLPSPMYSTPAMDEPLALIKKPRKEPERTEGKMKNTKTNQLQMRPSVITCVPSRKPTVFRSDVHSSHASTVISRRSYDHVVDEHFQRSLGVDYQQAGSRQLSMSVSVDDHFAKALGDKWLLIKSKLSSCSSAASSPPSSPAATPSPTYSHSPNQTDKESPSTSSPGLWSEK
ncbi:vestigial like 4 like [Aplochiton taeniatus]